MRDAIRIGTRGSALARWQADFVAQRLQRLAAPRPIDIITIKTEGDANQHASLTVIGGQGVFTKEIQRALLAQEIDIAVHSLKDLPTEPIDGLVLAAVPERGPSGDVLISQSGIRFDELPAGSTVATGSIRRRALLRHRRSDVRLADIRGNVDTRLRKLANGEFDALVLAHAGLSRLGLDDRISEVLDPDWMIPAVGQGALGLECRTNDTEVLKLLMKLDEPKTHAAVLSERSLLRHLGGGCQVPIGAIAQVNNGMLRLRGVVLTIDGTERIDGENEGPMGDAEQIGERLAAELLRKGPGNRP